MSLISYKFYNVPLWLGKYFYGWGSTSLAGELLLDLSPDELLQCMFDFNIVASRVKLTSTNSSWVA